MNWRMAATLKGNGIVFQVLTFVIRALEFHIRLVSDVVAEA